MTNFVAFFFCIRHVKICTQCIILAKNSLNTITNYKPSCFTLRDKFVRLLIFIKSIIFHFQHQDDLRTQPRLQFPDWHPSRRRNEQTSYMTHGSSVPRPTISLPNQFQLSIILRTEASKLSASVLTISSRPR